MTEPVDPGSASPRDRLREIWRRIESGEPGPHTSVIVPSLTFDREELAKIQGIQFFEERLLFSILRLQDPRARTIFVTSQPVHPHTVEYLLGLLPHASSEDVGRRLFMLSTYDPSPRPLTEKILERPRLVERIRRHIGEPDSAYLTCFNTTMLEQRLALELDIPLNGADPDVAWIGTKSGSRRVFEEASVTTGFGLVGIRTRADVVRGLEQVAEAAPDANEVVIKLDDSFAGAGNAVCSIPHPLPEETGARRLALDTALRDLRPASGEPPDAFLAKLERMGGVVERFLCAPDGTPLGSPSVQLHIDPQGEIHLLSTHEQVLGGPIGQTYVGCRFPADEAHRASIQRQALAVAHVLAGHGAMGRFGIDFLVAPGEAGCAPTTYAIEINLRMGGTTFPFMALQSLAPGTLDPTTGEYVTSGGPSKYYFATDNLRSPAYVGLSPEDFLEIVRSRGLTFDPRTRTGPAFYMIGALSQFGRVGVTCIADHPDEAEAMYRRVVGTLDAECAAEGGKWSPPTHPMGMPISSME